MQTLKSRKGQGLVEYILIVALMGIISIAVINGLNKETQSGFKRATSQLNNEFSKI